MRNGAFFDWSGFKPGTWIRTKSIIEKQPESRRESTLVTVLVERTPGGVLLQIGHPPFGSEHGNHREYPKHGRNGSEGNLRDVPSRRHG